MNQQPLMFNPWTGRPRHPADIKSDPQGILMVPPDTPLLAANKQEGVDTGTQAQIEARSPEEPN